MTTAAQGPRVPDGIDLGGVSRFVSHHIPGAVGPFTVELISGGRSNLTYAVSDAGGSWVLRRPPLGHVLPTAHDMAREYRVLAALADSDVPVPRPLALCEDIGVTGAPFYVMERRYGIVLHDALPPGFAPMPDDRRRMSEAVIDTMVRLHAIDYHAAGLDEFGRPEGFIARQVRRWGEQWERSKTRDVPAIDAVRTRLARAVPQALPPTIVHGDLRLGNLMFDAADPGRVVAVFDWEMSTIGDPLADLGWVLAMWAEPGDPQAWREGLAPLTPMLAEGFLRRDALAARYATATGRDITALPFYVVFGLYKLTVIIEGIHARYVKGQTVGEGFEVYGPHVPMLAETALLLADAAGL